MRKRDITIKTYSEMIILPTFKERCDYARLNSSVGEETFGWRRYLNQKLYTSPEWQRVRRKVILRDDGCDLADPDRPIGGMVLIHHLNPISYEDIVERNSKVFDLDNLVCVSLDTHNAIHYGEWTELVIPPITIERQPYDTCPWR